MSTQLFTNCSQLVTCAGPARARRGAELRDLAIIENGALLTRDGRIVASGPRDEILAQADVLPGVDHIDCAGGVLMPGFVDSHTHAIFGKPRHEEQELRAAGVGYMEIAKRGGGIHSSVRDLRTRSEQELVGFASARLARLASHGTTTVEVKSGYGLSLDDELKSLRAIRTLSATLPLRLVPTFLGAHEIPLEYRARNGGRREYLDLLLNDMLPAVVRDDLARFADVFCEPGVYTIEESREYLRHARSLGLDAKLHADELEPAGGAELAAELGATSADHLAAVSDGGIRALAASQTVATLLPHTMMFLGKQKQAPARELIEAGAAIALATDFNPGTSPTGSMPLVLTLGVSQLRLSVAEAVLASTVNGAAALGLAGEVGQITKGFSADVALFDAEDVREIPYWSGENMCRATWVRGRQCHASNLVQRGT